MQLRLCKTVVIGAIAVTSAHADFTYQETTRITGGAMVGMMRFAGAFSKDAKKINEPVQSTISIKGNRMVHKTADSATITDLDSETITHIDFVKKSYSVMTFAQMKEAMEQMAQKMKSQTQGQPSGADVDWDVKINDTGATKNIQGSMTHEMITTMTMKATDQQSGARGGISVNVDSWIAPKVPGYDEVRDFHRRMAEKIAWAPGANPLMNRPDMARAMAAAMKEGSKLDGIPLLTIMKMNGAMDGMPAQSQQQQSARSSQSSSPPPTSLSGALGGALAGRLGRRKNDDSANQSNQSTGDPGSLMETTTEVTSYSSSPADPAMFEVPAGFQKVESDMMRGTRGGK